MILTSLWHVSRICGDTPDQAMSQVCDSPAYQRLLRCAPPVAAKFAVSTMVDKYEGLPGGLDRYGERCGR